MRNQLIGSLFCVLVLQPVSSLAQDDNYFGYWQELSRVDMDFSQAATESGRLEAFIEVLGEGSVLFRQGPVDARELYQRSQTISSLDQLSWRRHFIDVSRDGDLGFTVGPNLFTGIQESQDEEDRQQVYSHLVNVWHKVNGDWKLMADMVIRVPGFLSMDVEPDYRDTQLVLAETAHPALVADNDLQSLIDADILFGRSINVRGGQRALIRYGLQNQRVYLPGMAPAVGADSASIAYGKFLDRRIGANNLISASYKGGFLSSSKELGYTYGIMTSNTEDGESGFRTNYLRVWRFSVANEWRIAMELLSDY